MAWIATQGDSRYNPPTDYCEGSNSVSVDFVSPHDHDSNLPGTFNVEIKAESTGDVKEVRLEIDGSGYRTFTGKPYSDNVNLSAGVHKLRAIARDSNGKEASRDITVGVGVAWDYTPSPSPTPTALPTPTVTL